MDDIHSVFDDILAKLASLRKEIDQLHRSEHHRQQTEESLTLRNRIHTLLNAVRANIIKKRSHERLYESVCKSFVESGLFHAAWIGLVDTRTESVQPVISARLDEEQFGVSIVHAPADMALKGQIVDTVIEAQVFISGDVLNDERLKAFHDTAARMQYRSLGAFPIADNGVVRAVLVLLSNMRDVFQHDTADHIGQVCRELSVGVRRLIYEEELQREIDSLKDTITEYRQISDRHFIGIAIIQDGIIKYANDAIANLFGYPLEEIMQWQPNEFSRIIHPDDVDRVTDPARRTSEHIDGIVYYSYRIITGRDQVRKIHRYSKTIFYGGKHAHLVAIIDDKMAGVTQEPAPEVESGPHPPGDIYEETEEPLFDHNPYPSFLIDYDTFEILKVNNAAITQYGYSGQEFLEMSIRDLYPSDELSQFLEHLRQLPMTLQMEVITKHQKRDKTDIDVELAARYLRLAGKTVVLLIARDVTNRKWAEEVIRESETNYRNIFNSVGYMLLVLDRDARLLDVNTAAASLLQHQREEIIGQDFDFINAKGAKSLGEFRDYLIRAFELGEERCEWDLQRNDGRVIPVAMVMHKGMYFGHEVVVAAASKIEDSVTKTPVSDEFSETISSAPAALAIANKEGTFTWANQSFADLIGVPVDALLGRDITTLKVESKSEEEFDRLVQIIYQGKVWSDRVIAQTGNGRHVELDLTVTPVKSNGDSISRFVLTGKNVAEEKERMMQMLQKQKMESIDTISRAIAHDFNNILGIILGYASFLEKRKDDPEKFHADLEEIKGAVQRGANLIKQMLAYTHRNDVSYESIQVNDVIQDVINMLGDTFPETIDITLELDRKLPDIAMSRHQLQQIITEFCVNARDAIEDPGAGNPGRGRIVIETRLYDGRKLGDMFPSAHEDAYVEIRVTDTGVGMDEDTKNKAFDPFFSAKEYGKGKGLGLTAVYGIVKSYNGFIRVESEPIQGTVFMVYLPVKADEKAEPVPETDTAGSEPSEVIEQDVPEAGKESADHPATDETATAEKTILLIEDEQSLLQLLQHVLEENGYRVLTATDGLEGVRMYEQHKDEISMVLSDVGLPKLDGFNAFLQMRRINPDVKAVLASGYLDDKVKADLYKEGIKDFIRKPYQTDEILSKINEVVQVG